MNIAVLLKQVPAVSDIQLAADNNLVRVGAPSMLNPVDLHALEAALALKDQEGGTVTLVTMGTALASDPPGRHRHGGGQGDPAVR